MRRSFYAALLSLAALAPFAPRAEAGGRNLDGQVAPELRLTDGTNGASTATTLASLRGKVVCLKFWLTHCPICRRTLPEFQALHDRYGRAGVVCLGVVIDSVSGVSPYLREAGWTFQVGCDPSHENADRYGVTRYPGDYVIGPDGVVRASDGFPTAVIDEELRKARVLELGEVPASMRAVRDAVAENDYGAALRLAEAAAKAADAPAAVRTATARVLEIAKQRQDNRFARADAWATAGRRTEARAELARVVEDFADTSLGARARERLAAFDAPR